MKKKTPNGAKYITTNKCRKFVRLNILKKNKALKLATCKDLPNAEPRVIEHKKGEKLDTYDLSLLLEKLNLTIMEQPVLSTFAMPAGIINTVIKWEFEGSTNEKMKPNIIENCSTFPKKRWVNNLKRRVKFKGSCLNQDTKTFSLTNILNLFIAFE